MDSVDVLMPEVVARVVEVPQISTERIMEHIVFEVPQEREQERIAAQGSGYLGASCDGENRELDSQDGQVGPA